MHISCEKAAAAVESVVVGFLAVSQIPEWAETIHNFVRTYGLGGSVMLVEELRTGDDVLGTGEQNYRHAP